MTTSNLAEATRGSRFSLDKVRTVLPFATLAVLYIITVIASPGYLQGAQIGGLLQLASILGIVAIGQTVVMLIGGIDLSVGAVVTLTNLLTAAILAGKDANLFTALIISLVAGAAIGLVNGGLIALIKIPDLVASLATMTIVIGLGYLITNGAPRGTSSAGLNDFMTQRFAGFFTFGFLLWAVLAVIAILVLRKTVFGRRVYSVGLNREASHFAAVPVNGTIVQLYIISGIAAGLAGFLLTGYTGSSYLGSGTSYQLSTIAAVVLGGTSIFGGKGGYGGTIAGVLITVLLLSILRVVGIPQAGQNIAYGVVILVMLVLFSARGRRRH